MCLEKGYDSDEVRELLKVFGFTAHIRARGEGGETPMWAEGSSLGVGADA